MLNSKIGQIDDYTCFLDLLSASIWNRPLEIDNFGQIDKSGWKEIAAMAHRQSVSALIADKALSLPAECLPPGDMTLRFISVIEQTKHMNRKMISLLKELQEEYIQADFPFLLLKGLANSVNYPKPLLRSPGDIDLLLYRKGDYERAKEWLIQKSVEIEPAGTVHYKYKRNSIYVENHSNTTYFSNKRYNKLFIRVEDSILTKSEFSTVNIDSELTISVLPVTFNAFFLFQHLFTHFVNLGVGFRQVCDWVLFLHKHQAEIDREKFNLLATQFALLYPMQLFARIAVNYLEAPEHIFPFPMIQENQHSEKVMCDILEGGNFGFHRLGKKRPKKKIAGILFSFVNRTKRSIKFGAVSPQHCAILPFKMLINLLFIGFKKVLKELKKILIAE